MSYTTSRGSYLNRILVRKNSYKTVLLSFIITRTRKDDAKLQLLQHNCTILQLPMQGHTRAFTIEYRHVAQLKSAGPMGLTMAGSKIIDAGGRKTVRDKPASLTSFSKRSFRPIEPTRGRYLFFCMSSVLLRSEPEPHVFKSRHLRSVSVQHNQIKMVGHTICVYF